VGRDFGLLIIVILGGTLASLLLAIVVTDWKRAGQMDRTLEQVFHIASTRTASTDVPRVRQAHNDIVASLTSSPSATGAPEHTATIAVIRELLSRDDITVNERAALTDCPDAFNQPAADTARKPRLESCLLAVDAVGLGTNAVAPSAEMLRAADALLKQVRESQQEQRGFWLQLAQVILLNLLLPLLTAVFGYVFGRNQRASEDAGG
jgi:hypothetical protein